MAEDTGQMNPATSQGLIGEQGLDAGVTIIKKKGVKIEGYRSEGSFYMVKVIPAKGAPYFLLDRDGDGDLEIRRVELDPNEAIPTWKLRKW